MKNLCLIFFSVALLISNALLAQYDPSKINKKAIEIYNQGIEKAQGNQFNDAIELLQQSIQKDPNYIEA